jgi:hypothetical protein
MHLMTTILAAAVLASLAPQASAEEDPSGPQGDFIDSQDHRHAIADPHRACRTRRNRRSARTRALTGAAGGGEMTLKKVSHNVIDPFAHHPPNGSLPTRSVYLN